MSTKARQIQLLRSALGPDLIDLLNDDNVTEVMVNADGQVWSETAEGRVQQDIRLTTQVTERIIRAVAGIAGQDVTASSPIISSELPISGERFEGLLPPTVSAPSFVIRKPSKVVYRLEDFESQGLITHPQHCLLRSAIATRLNILIAGGTASGKTTFANALMAEIGEVAHRLILIEDTVELRSTARDQLQLRTVPGQVKMRDLVRSALRLRPDRIIIGEVRGGEALDLLKAWNTGHPGGITTLHANSAKAALHRLEQLVGEAATNIPRDLIAEAVDLVIHLTNRNGPRRVSEILYVTGIDAYGDYLLTHATLPSPFLVSTEETAS